MIKQAIKLGNSAAVIVPKGWESKKVKVELVEDSITKEIFEILKNERYLPDVIGVYLTGSYAREEEISESDIDILVITGKTNKSIKKGNYEILLISEDKLEYNLTKNLYLYSMVKEAKSILNDSLIQDYKKEKFVLSKNSVEEIKSMIKINKETLELHKEMNEKLKDGTAYSIVLRLRELYILHCIFNKKSYSTKEFFKIIENNEAEDLYKAYLRVKNNLKTKSISNLNGAENLLKYSQELLNKLW